MLWRIERFFHAGLALIVQEYAAGRVRLLLPLFQMGGICLYFYLPYEPAIWPYFVTLITLLLLYLWRRTEIIRVCCLLTGFFCVGFIAASLKTMWLNHPILQQETRTMVLKAYVENIERRDDNDRVLLRVHELGDTTLKRVRVVSRLRITQNVGEAVEVFVRLRPPPEPSRLGGYDFARDLYFRQIGAVGFTLGGFKAIDLPPAPWDVRLNAKIETMRQAISQHIRAKLQGETGAMADALVTGIRDGLTKDTQEAMRRAGTYHILSISGFHMTLVAAFVFALVRGGLALFPAITLYYPVKRIAGVIAFFAASFYLVLATPEVATLRSYLMIAVILLGVMSNRMAFTLNTLAVVVIIVCLIMPDSVLGPSFQMSFAATLVLVAGFTRVRLFSENLDETRSILRQTLVILTTGILGLAVSSFFAGLATLPFTAFHFNQFQAYGVFGNLLGAPIIEFLVMPLEIIALLLWPLGLDGWCWPIIGFGIDLFLDSSRWVASWPDSTRAVAAFSPKALGVYTLGFIVLVTFATRLRYLGLILIIFGIYLSTKRLTPFLMRESDGETVAIRNENGLMAVISPRATRFTFEQWQQANGEVVIPNSETPMLRQKGICDALRCDYTVQGKRIFYLFKPITKGDCESADIVVIRKSPDFPCKAIIFPLKESPERGGLMLDNQFKFHYAREGEKRPWMR